MKKVLFLIAILFLLALSNSYSQNLNAPSGYPFILTPVSEELQEKWKNEYREIHGGNWESLMSDKFTGFIQYAAISGLPEKQNMADYKKAVEVGDKFLRDNGYLFGMNDNYPQCIDVKGSENPELGYVWLYYSEQVFDGYPVAGTQVMMKVDYPGKVIEIRVRWYQEINIPKEETLKEEDIIEKISGMSVEYNGKGGQELIYKVKENDTGDLKKVIFPLRNDKEDTVKFYLAWKVSINKDEERNAWTFYLDAFTGEELYVKKNFK